MIEKIGRGKYSDVYKAVRVGEEGQEIKLSVLKILKPSIFLKRFSSTGKNTSLG